VLAWAEKLRVNSAEIHVRKMRCKYGQAVQIREGLLFLTICWVSLKISGYYQLILNQIFHHSK